MSDEGYAFMRVQDASGEHSGYNDPEAANAIANYDPINPSHYTSYRDIEVIQLTEQLNFNKGNVVKYTARAGLKNPDTEIQDLEKASWYLQREIARLKKNSQDISGQPVVSATKG